MNRISFLDRGYAFKGLLAVLRGKEKTSQFSSMSNRTSQIGSRHLLWLVPCAADVMCSFWSVWLHALLN